MTKLEQVVQSITKQQGKAKAGSAVWCVGEQLKDLLGMLGEEAAAVVAEEIDTKGHGIADCEKKIADFASAHKEENVGFCGPKDADRIVREFYGLGNFAPAQGGAGVLTPQALAGQLPFQGSQGRAAALEGECSPLSHAAHDSPLFREAKGASDGAAVLTSSVSADGADSFPRGEALETKKPFAWGTLDLEDFL